MARAAYPQIVHPPSRGGARRHRPTARRKSSACSGTHVGAAHGPCGHAGPHAKGPVRPGGAQASIDTVVPTFSPAQTLRMFPRAILKTRIGRPFSRHNVTAVESITPR